MPVYEYICKQCSEKFSLFQGIHSTDNDIECPKCASGTVKKVMSTFCCSSSSDTDAASSIPSSGFSGGG